MSKIAHTGPRFGGLEVVIGMQKARTLQPLGKHIVNRFFRDQTYGDAEKHRQHYRKFASEEF